MSTQKSPQLPEGRLRDLKFIVFNNDLDFYSIMSDGRIHYSGGLLNNGGLDLTLEEYVPAKNRDLAATRERLANYPDILATVQPDIWKTDIYSENEFMRLHTAHQRAKYLTAPKQISQAHYFDKLEVLPPENWMREGAFQHFRMCEYTTGSITEQLAEYNGVYLSKMIDVSDRETWISVPDFKGLSPLSPEENEKGFYV